MDHQSASKQALYFALINYIGVAIGAISTVIIYPLDKEFLGVVRFIEACAQIMYPLIVLGSTSALVNFYPTISLELRKDFFSFNLRALLKTAFIVGLVLLVWASLSHSQEVNYVLVGFPLAFALAYIELFKRQAANLQRISFVTLIEKVVPKLALALVFVGVLFVGVQQNIALGVYVITFYLMALVMAVYVYKHFKYSWGFDKAQLFTQLSQKKYYWYSLFAFAGSFGSFFAFRVDSLMIPFFISYDANGTYNIGVTLANTIAIPAAGIFALYGPVVSDLIKNRQLRDLNVKYQQTAIGLFFIGMLLLSCVFVGIESFFKMLPTYDSLADSVVVIYILGLSVVINMSTGFNNEIIAYSKYFRFNLYSILSLTFVNVGLNYLLLTNTNLGIVGVALASFASLTIYNVAKTIFIYRKMRLWPFTKSFLTVVLSVFAIAVVVYFLPLTPYNLLNLSYKIALVLMGNALLIYYVDALSLIRVFIANNVAKLFKNK